VGDEADRRKGYGRRGDDQALDFLADRLEAAERRFEGSLKKLETELDRLEDAVDERVRELEEFHIREQARTGERTARVVARTRRISSGGATAGAIGVALAIVEHFAHI
jgi:hypothetical protein